MSTATPREHLATVYGFPRQGPHRELKKVTEAYWAGRVDDEALAFATKELRLSRVAELRDAGLGEIPSNEFSLYDHVLDTTIMLGAIPERYRAVVADTSSLSGQFDQYFAMARGTGEVAPLEMTKWFNTNYHYLVPELDPGTTFNLNAAKPLDEFYEALAIGVRTRPVILGPVSYLLLSKASPRAPRGFRPLELLESVLPSYEELLGRLEEAGAEWVQIDEPILVTDQSDEVLRQVRSTYQWLGAVNRRPKILVASYFDRLGDALATLADSPIDGVAMDFTGPAAANLEDLAAIGGIGSKRLVAGVVNGHNVWRADLTKALSTLAVLLGLAGHVDVSASCSLLHVPLDVELEASIDSEIKQWLAFARQKLDELSVLARGLSYGRDAVAKELDENVRAMASRSSSALVNVKAVRDRSAEVAEKDLARGADFPRRKKLQASRLKLPLLPTTTIGSFPQTSRLRQARADLAARRIDKVHYEEQMRQEIAEVIKIQEQLGVDVLVHGEAERNDMVQYFAEQLEGFLVTANGWVQSYGTRYVRPPIIVGDVSRPTPMTVSWTTFAQSLTERPVKGMLTGPVTMLAWSFVRDDQPLGETARQVALALRDEVVDLERAGTAIIQVDEPALRETLPLRRSDWEHYLRWAVDAFRLTTAGVRDDTQIHTHMCYADFGDVLSAIIALDADVISLEAARSEMAIVADLARVSYKNEIGPGVWDIHSPRVPSVEEISSRISAAASAVALEQLWINPDCGLKTRGYEEVRATLANLVEAAQLARTRT